MTMYMHSAIGCFQINARFDGRHVVLGNDRHLLYSVCTCYTHNVMIQCAYMYSTCISVHVHLLCFVYTEAIWRNGTSTPSKAYTSAESR